MKKTLLLLFAILIAGVGNGRAQDMKSTPLTFEATNSGAITFTLKLGYGTDASVMNAIEYKKNDGAWTTYTWNEAISVENSDKVAFRGNNVKYYGNGSPSFESHITSTADVYVYGNMMSLIDSTDFAALTTLTGDWNFAKLFRKEGENPWDPPVAVTTIKSHPSKDIVLPATSLTNYCYAGLFAGCSGITRAPELPATTMTVGCYEEMFRGTGLTAVPALPATKMIPYSYDAVGEYGSIDCYMQMFQDCTSLTTVPVDLLPATTLVHGVYQNMFEGCTNLTNTPTLPATDLTGGDQCYTSMFKDCTSLATAPELPATTLDDMCYAWMFSGCTSLATAPVLPATTLTIACYHRMFEGCTSLTTAPDLPASSLTEQCYGGMFDGCTKLNYVKCLAVNFGSGADMELGDWLVGVSATGTFVKAKMGDWPEGTYGIPSGWTKQDEAGTETMTLTGNSDEEATPCYWTTYYNATVGFMADPNTKVYKAKVNSDKTKVVLSEVTNRIVPAGNAVVLKSTAPTLTLTYNATTGTLSGNELRASASQIYPTPENTYMLIKGASGVGFYHYPSINPTFNTQTIIPARKAYLTIAASARSFLGIDEGETTSIHEGYSMEELGSAVWYTLDGRRLDAMPTQKGIYVSNGKKIIIK